MQQVKNVAEIHLDIGLDGSAWDVSAPAGELSKSPFASEGSVRIKYSQIGMYEVTYQNLDDLGLAGVIEGENIADLRMYWLTFENWQQPKPKDVLFLGDGSNDVADFLNNQNGGMLTPVAMRTSDFLDFASDDWFVTFNHSRVPDMAIGRLPAKNVIELEGIINKIMAYEQGTGAPSGAKCARLCFLL